MGVNRGTNVDPDLKHLINVYLRARITLIIVTTPEEERAVQLVRDVCAGWNPARQCLIWDTVDGFSVLSGSSAISRKGAK